jgi:magnesium chelatase family protein
MAGPPGAGKSLLASCLPGILPELTAAEALEVSMVASVAGTLEEGRISRARPYRAPHHSASIAALTGGGLKVRPGEISMAHLGVLFLDELPEFQRAVLDSLRQPLETGEVTVARANAHVTFPARVQHQMHVRKILTHLSYGIFYDHCHRKNGHLLWAILNQRAVQRLFLRTSENAGT